MWAQMKGKMMTQIYSTLIKGIETNMLKVDGMVCRYNKVNVSFDIFVLVKSLVFSIIVISTFV